MQLACAYLRLYSASQSPNTSYQSVCLHFISSCWLSRACAWTAGQHFVVSAKPCWKCKLLRRIAGIKSIFYIQGCLYVLGSGGAVDASQTELFHSGWLDVLSSEGTSYSRHNRRLTVYALRLIAVIWSQSVISMRNMGSWMRVLWLIYVCGVLLPQSGTGPSYLVAARESVFNVRGHAVDSSEQVRAIFSYSFAMQT